LDIDVEIDERVSFSSLKDMACYCFGLSSSI